MEYADRITEKYLFVEAPQSVKEMKKICRELDPPLLANMVEGGKPPMLTVEELEDLGFSIALFPGSLQRSAFHSFLKVLDTRKRKVLEKEV